METPYFPQCILCELTIQNKVGYTVVHVLENFEKPLNHVRQLKSTFLVIHDDFNAQSKSWWCKDITSHEGSLIKST